MRSHLRKLIFIFSVLFIWKGAEAQPVSDTNIPLSRLYFHETLDATQQKILDSDGIKDSAFTPTPNSSLNEILTYDIIQKVDSLSKVIETDSTLDNNNKIKFLRGLNELLSIYISKCRYDSVKYSVLTPLLDEFAACIEPEKNGLSIEPVIRDCSYETADIIIHTISFSGNPGYKACTDLVMLKYCDKFRDKAMKALDQNSDYYFTDSLISEIAKRDPQSIYTYAASTTALATKIQNNPDSLVRIISQMARQKTGQQFFPFLDNIYRGKTSFKDITDAMENDVQYYKLLVQTSIDYADMLRKGEQPLALDVIRHRLEQKAADPFINSINGLHEVNDERIRFKALEPFSAEDLYYMAVMGEEIIYTSSYVKGVYPRIWQKMKDPKSDLLLMNVKFDHFKKFIKMAANYNTLDDFLKRMDNNNAQLLMKAFVNGLDRTSSLEDAVDVANSYASITDKPVRDLILTQVQWNLQQAKAAGNTKGTDIYGILNTLFLSMDSSNKINVSEALGIPPVYYMRNSSLRDSSGKIVIQQFFYGDKDGKSVFASFLNSVSNANWKISYSEEWVTVSSTKGVPVVIYANKPLDEEKNLDAKAQSDLDDYLASKNIDPTIVIHRGHSYWLPSTIEQLAPSSKVILLGSCGAYQNLDKILKICPSAQIVASKQTGSGLVNGPMISLIIETLRQGKDLNWPTLWQTLSGRVGSKELFDDYVPPHKNLGALFIMAYKKLQESRQQTDL